MAKRTTGGVSKKIINGKTYYYFQWYEDGKRRSRTISEQEANDFLSESAPALNYGLGDEVFPGVHLFTGEVLSTLAKSVANYKERFCMPRIMDYLSSPHDGRLFALYGLRRTGKTTLMLQAIHKLNRHKQCAYITLGKGATLMSLNQALKRLLDAGVAYVFIDEVTLIDDFIDGSAFLADVYGRFMNIVLSGTDSLGFFLASKEQLYDRVILEHTTYTSFKEFSYVTGMDDIDQYIEYGGTFIHEGINYHKGNRLEFGQYSDSSIVHNIQHSLERYRDGYNFMRLKGHYDNDDLTNLINRVIQDQNHRFVKNVLNKRFKSRDFGSLKQLVLNQNSHPALVDFIASIDEAQLYDDLINALDIVDAGVTYEQEDILEMQRYLELLDVIEEVETVNMNGGARSMQYVFSQPGLRYAQCRELIEAILKQDAFAKLLPAEAKFLMDLLCNDVKGRMMEEIVLLEAKYQGFNPFRVSFLVGEFDMAIYNMEEDTCCIFEIKHSAEVAREQTRFIADQELCDAMEARYGKILHRYVLYRGNDEEHGNISYRNVERYLKDLGGTNRV